MNIIDFWKQEVDKRTHYSQYDGNEFLENLDKNVPDWKEQVRDKTLWPNLHCQGMNINETCYLKVIIEAAGLEFAEYLVENQWNGKHLDSSVALDFCTEYINTCWFNFSDFTKEKIIEFKLRQFLSECSTNVVIWNSLEDKWKIKIVLNAITKENLFISDVLLFKIWSEKMNFEDYQYLVFQTEHFRHAARDVKECDSMHRHPRHIEHYLERWDIPKVFLMGDRLQYSRSEKIILLETVLNNSTDNENMKLLKTFIDNIKCNIQNNI